MRLLPCMATVFLISLALVGGVGAEEKNVTWTGWFSDVKCAAPRAAAGVFTITNPDCAKSCLEKGAAPVFISEQAKAIFQVKDYSSIIDDLGYRLEIQGAVDEAAKTIAIRNVKRLAYQGAACARPRKSAEK
jgi:hypothetical protein